MLANWSRMAQGTYWLLLFGAVLAAWAVLYAMAIPAELREASRLFGSDFWAGLCVVTPDMAGYGRLAAMWALMSTAMMLPTAVPAFIAYRDLASSGATVRPAVLSLGFLGVWLGFSLIAAALQMLLFRNGLVSDFGDSRSTALSVALLAVAGIYQFSPLKEICLSKCRAPLSFFLQHWDEGALRLGVRLGATCLGCCWALMLLAFVGGVMSLAFMALATVLMTLEKLPDIGRLISRPLGIALISAAGWIAVTGI